ncbi:TrmB family transcriptional regulator [Bacillus sp. BRMEA1]|nr:TrmB family transcriptional regulator [Neobacillus endophyticus]
MELLKKIGLSDLEARCYLTLLEDPGLSGYEVAKRVSVSRSNVYAALRSLTDKGVCRVIEGDPTHYDAVPANQLIKFLQQDFELTAKQLLTSLEVRPSKIPAFYNLQGDRQLEKAIQRVIANAETSIVVDIWSEDLQRVEDALLDAEQRGVKITVITIGQCNTLLKQVIEHSRDENWPGEQERKFSVLCDSHQSIIGSFGGDIKSTALETSHPAVSEMLKNAFYHDAVMEQIERDFAEELRAKYGEHYKEIVDRLLKTSGLIR